MVNKRKGVSNYINENNNFFSIIEYLIVVLEMYYKIITYTDQKPNI